LGILIYPGELVRRAVEPIGVLVRASTPFPTRETGHGPAGEPEDGRHCNKRISPDAG
jgi:hypothetical protein